MVKSLIQIRDAESKAKKILAKAEQDKIRLIAKARDSRLKEFSQTIDALEHSNAELLSKKREQLAKYREEILEDARSDAGDGGRAQ